MTKDVIAAIKERRSVRRFTSEPVDEATVGRILEAGACAPSGGNLQPWLFYVVLQQATKELLAQAARQSFVASAPVVLVVVAVPQASGVKYGARGSELYCLQDTAAATQNMLLAATGFGLATCWVGAFDEKLVAEALGCSEQERPVVMIPLGYPDKEPGPGPARYDLSRITKIIR